jgi:mannose-6-phosphate isomerase
VLYPLTFHPLFKERVWGGRNLERLYHKPLPPGVPIGESWEISDRPGDVSVAANGPLAGKDLRWLMEHHERDLLGDARSRNGRFPLLVKILDAQDALSLQVHPPANRAAEPGVEPKTELWYITNALPKAELCVGLKRGVTRTAFEDKIRAGTVAECFHHVPVKAGDAMFLPSGRVHALGAGIVLFEIQQNSDTTYRVFDWNRLGLDGKPRELHLPQSLASIDFNDFEPTLLPAASREAGPAGIRHLVNDVFAVDLIHAPSSAAVLPGGSGFKIIAVLEGNLTVAGKATSAVELRPGEFCLVPAALKTVELRASKSSSYLLILPGK